MNEYTVVKEEDYRVILKMPWKYFDYVDYLWENTLCEFEYKDKMWYVFSFGGNISDSGITVRLSRDE